MSKEIRFGDFLKSKKFEIIFVLFVSFIFVILLFNQGVYPKIVIYGLVISYTFLIGFGYLGYLKYKKKYNELKRFVNSDNLTYESELEGALENLLVREIENIKRNKSEELSQDKENLKKMNEFYTLWAHQIKTPISAANLIIEDEGSLDDIKLEMLRIEDYVNVLLAYFRHHSYSTDYVFKKVPLDEVIRASIRKYSSIFIKKKINLNYEPTDLEVTTDEKWLGFIIEQILSNSLKYTIEGKISIRSQEDTLIIRDTGIGINESDLPRIFELGFTGYNGRIYTKSTGIGLNLVKSISNALNIGVDISSKVGEFTEVRLKFKNISDITKM